jgi:metal-dependent amidase/aminoacylase/carboxypeptidase family protein
MSEAAQPRGSSPLERVSHEVEAIAAEAIDLSHRVHSHPEIAFQEHQS